MCGIVRDRFVVVIMVDPVAGWTCCRFCLIEGTAQLSVPTSSRLTAVLLRSVQQRKPPFVLLIDLF